MILCLGIRVDIEIQPKEYFRKNAHNFRKLIRSNISCSVCDDHVSCPMHELLWGYKPAGAHTLCGYPARASSGSSYTSIIPLEPSLRMNWLVCSRIQPGCLLFHPHYSPQVRFADYFGAMGYHAATRMTSV